MASLTKMQWISFFLASVLFVKGALCELVCEVLPVNMCSLSIASSGKRCLLENYASKDGKTEFQCRTSEVVVDSMAEWIETEECVRACGVDRNSVGISSDSLMEPRFTAKLCAPACYENCPNIVDLYLNLAKGEGVFLRDLCDAQHTNPRRAMAELLNSGAALAPGSDEESLLMSASSPTPM